MLPVDGAEVVHAEFIGHPDMIDSSDSLRRKIPLPPPLAISTGRVASSSPSPGTAFNSPGNTPDRARLRLILEPEQGRSLLFVTWNLFTAEIPAFSTLGFDDVFSVHVVDTAGRRNLVQVSSNDERLYPVSASRAAGSAFDLYARHPAILPADYGLGQPAAWMSGWRTTGFAIDSDGPVELEVEVRDGLDGLMDTQVLIQKIQLTALMPAPLARGVDSGRGGGQCIDFADYCNALFPLPGTFAGSGNPQEPPRICEFDTPRLLDERDFRNPREFRGAFFPEHRGRRRDPDPDCAIVFHRTPP